jgi:hypothetical protein
MDCFIKKIFQDYIDEAVHSKFVRFGRGIYEKRAVLSLHKTSKIKLRGSFEYANDFVLLVADLADVKFSGLILSRDKLGLENEKKKQNLYVYDVKNMGSEEVKELENGVYALLLDADGEDIKLKIKKRLPKPGKSNHAKVDDKFCQLEASLRYWPQIRNAFFWDVPDAKRVKVEHDYEINELILPENEKDPLQLRLKAKRKGEIKRKINIDNREKIEEKKFEV